MFYRDLTLQQIGESNRKTQVTIEELDQKMLDQLAVAETMEEVVKIYEKCPISSRTQKAAIRKMRIMRKQIEQDGNQHRSVEEEIFIDDLKF